MKKTRYMFISDIHGNYKIFNECIDAFKQEHADVLVLLGDTSARIL